jgi:hypothetical protein
MFADFDRAVGLVEVRRVSEELMTPWQKVFSKAYYCTRNYARLKDKLDQQLMPQLKAVLIEVFGKPVTDNVVSLVERRARKNSHNALT